MAFLKFNEILVFHDDTLVTRSKFSTAFLDHLKNGVIALSFINLLLDLSRKHEKSGIKNNPARDNWHLAYTLINNGQLRYYRKHAIEARKNSATVLRTTL